MNARLEYQSLEAGRARVRKLNADRERFDFIVRLAQDGDNAGIVLTRIESDFVGRMLNYQHSTPDLHPGDANICDSLRRKYQARLNGGRK